MATDELQHEYVVVAMTHRGVFKPLVIHEDFEEARSSALRKKGGFISVPTDGNWDRLEVDHGYPRIFIYKVDRVPRGVPDPKVHIR